MSEDDFKEKIEKRRDELLEKVVIDEKVAEKIIGLLLAIKEGKFGSAKPPKGILFYGPPGTGKTEFMRNIGNVLGISDSIIMIRGPELISQYYGKSESRLRAVFKKASMMAEKSKLALIFIDELDSLAPRRDKTSGELEQRMVGQLLALMDGLEKEKKEGEKGHVVVIGSTNMPNSLDPALRRPGRFDMEFEFDLPDKEKRKEILKILLEKNPKERYELTDEAIENIAEITEGFTGADLMRLVNEALIESILTGKEGEIDAETLKEVKNKISPTGMREYRLVDPKNHREEIGDERNKIAEYIAEKFAKNLDDEKEHRFISIMLKNEKADEMASTIAYDVKKEKNKDKNEKADEMASTIASKVKEKNKDVIYLRFSGTRFRSRWFGETEESIRYMFDKIKRQACVVFIKGIDTIADPNDEHLRGAYAEFEDSIYQLKEENSKVLLIVSLVDEKNKEKIEKMFPDGVLNTEFSNLH